MLPQIPIVRITEAKSISLPRYPDGIGTSMVLTSSGSETVKINPHHFEVFKTGLAIALPVGIEAQIRSLKNTGEKGVIVLGAPITLDASDRKEITVTLYNASSDAVVVKHDEPIALLVFSPVLRVEWQDMTGGNISRIKRQADRQAAVEAMHKKAPAEAVLQSSETALDEFEPVMSETPASTQEVPATVPETTASTQEVPATVPEMTASTQASDATDEDAQQAQIFEQKEQEAFAEQEHELEQDQLLDEAQDELEQDQLLDETQDELEQIEQEQILHAEPAQAEPEKMETIAPVVTQAQADSILPEDTATVDTVAPVETEKDLSSVPKNVESVETVRQVSEPAQQTLPEPATQLQEPDAQSEQTQTQGIEEPLAPPDILAEFERIERDFKPNE